MSAATTRIKATFALSNGFEFAVVFNVSNTIVSPTDPIVLAIVEAINTLTGGWGFRIELSKSEPHAVTPTTSALYVNEDKGEFVFSGDGQSATLKLPGIQPTAMAADKIHIPADSPGIAKDFVDAVVANAVTVTDEPLVGPTFGIRRTARKTLKK